jgi:hypothetical protein
MTDDELRVNLESLHAACHDLFEASQRHDAQIAQNAALIAQNAKQIAENGTYIRALAKIAEDALDSIKRLERIATAHQDRLDDHQSRIENLEDK